MLQWGEFEYGLSGMAQSTLEALLEKLDQVREQLLLVLEPLPDEALVVANAVNGLSVAELLALLTAWEAELVTGLMRLDQGKKPERLLQLLAEPDELNVTFIAEGGHRDLDRIFDDFQRVRLQLEEWLELFSERDLSNPKRFKWLNGRSLAEVVLAMTVEHEAQFIPALSAFAGRWLAEEAARAEGMIPLTAVSVQEKENDNQSESD